MTQDEEMHIPYRSKNEAELKPEPKLLRLG